MLPTVAPRESVALLVRTARDLTYWLNIVAEEPRLGVESVVDFKAPTKKKGETAAALSTGPYLIVGRPTMPIEDTIDDAFFVSRYRNRTNAKHKDAFFPADAIAPILSTGTKLWPAPAAAEGEAAEGEEEEARKPDAVAIFKYRSERQRESRKRKAEEGGPSENVCEEEPPTDPLPEKESDEARCAAEEIPEKQGNDTEVDVPIDADGEPSTKMAPPAC